MIDRYDHAIGGRSPPGATGNANESSMTLPGRRFGGFGTFTELPRRGICFDEEKAGRMDKISLTALARQQLAAAHRSESGRAAHTVYGGHQHTLRQTLVALTPEQRSPTTTAPARLRCRWCRGASN